MLSIRHSRRLAVTAALLAGVALAVLPLSPASAAAPGWSAPVNANYPNDAYALSCPSKRFCMAVGYGPAAEGGAAAYHSGTWSAPVTANPDGVLTSVSCASASFCEAADNNGNLVTWNGTSWSAPVLVDPGQTVHSISCPSASFCMAVDVFGQALMFNGATWRLDPDRIFPGTGGFISTFVSCASAKFCMAVSVNGYAASWDGRAWSAPVNVVGDTSVYGFSSVSCPADGFCVALSSNTVGYYSGGVWSATEGVDYGSYLSCPDRSFCLSADLQADSFTWNGSSWSAPMSMGNVEPFAVSCPTKTFCIAVGGSGQAVTYTSPK